MLLMKFSNTEIFDNDFSKGHHLQIIRKTFVRQLLPFRKLISNEQMDIPACEMLHPYV